MKKPAALNTQEPIKMRVTKDVGDGETHWVRLNNRQQYGLLAAPAGHRNHLLVSCFPFKIRRFLVSLCPSGPLQRLSSQPTHHGGGYHTDTFACSNVLFTDCCTGRSRTKHSPAAIQAHHRY